MLGDCGGEGKGLGLNTDELGGRALPDQVDVALHRLRSHFGQRHAQRGNHVRVRRAQVAQRAAEYLDAVAVAGHHGDGVVGYGGVGTRECFEHDTQVVGQLIRELLDAERGQLLAKRQDSGTGLGPSNLTPEVSLERISTRLHGVETNILIEGLAHSERAGLCRGVVGLTSREPGGSLIVNAPSSRGGIRDTLTVILRLWPSLTEWVS